MIREYTHKKFEKICSEKLQKAKKSFKAIVMDQDGTVKGENDLKYKNSNLVALLRKIVHRNKYPAIITGSGASALKSFTSLVDFYRQKKYTNPTYIGIGNGVTLYKFDQKGRSELYNFTLTISEVKSIVKVWKKVYTELKIQESDLQQKGLITFRKFMETDWTGYIPKEYLSVFKQYNGQCFTEKIKVTVVFPAWDETRQRKLVGILQKNLDKILGKGLYFVSRGDDIFIHINHALKIDPKLFALQRIVTELGLDKNQVITFGDMPLDNDKGLLFDSRLPFTFTNRFFNKKDQQKPPFFLPGSLISPVGSVYNAIDYLLL